MAMIRILLSTKLGELRMTQAELSRITGIRPNTIRLSIGTEHIDDIIEDHRRAVS